MGAPSRSSTTYRNDASSSSIVPVVFRRTQSSRSADHGVLASVPVLSIVIVSSVERPAAAVVCACLQRVGAHVACVVALEVLHLRAALDAVAANAASFRLAVEDVLSARAEIVRRLASGEHV